MPKKEEVEEGVEIKASVKGVSMKQLIAAITAVGALAASAGLTGGLVFNESAVAQTAEEVVKKELKPIKEEVHLVKNQIVVIHSNQSDDRQIMCALAIQQGSMKVGDCPSIKQLPQTTDR